MNISPIVVPSPNLNSNLIADPSIKRALERALHCDVILQSFSPVDTSAPPYLDSHLKEDDLNHLRQAGEIGDFFHVLSTDDQTARTLITEVEQMLHDYLTSLGKGT